MGLTDDNLAKAITKAGRILLESGAETYRVEDTMTRIALSYGVEVVDAYATPTMLIISFSLDGKLTHNIKRVNKKDTNLEKIEKVNSLSRMVSNELIDIQELNRLLDEIDSLKHDNLLINASGAAICTFGFAFFFGGGIRESIMAMIIGIIITIFDKRISKIFPSTFFIHLFGAAILTFMAIIFSDILSYDQNIVIISSLMLLVPGLAITNAIRDSVRGDLLSGLAMTAEAIFIAVSLAVGSGVVISIMGVF